MCAFFLLLMRNQTQCPNSLSVIDAEEKKRARHLHEFVARFQKILNANRLRSQFNVNGPTPQLLCLRDVHKVDAHHANHTVRTFSFS